MICATTGLAALTQEQLEAWAAQARAQEQGGRLPDYIPLLAKADPRWLAAEVRLAEGKSYTVGEAERSLVLMSVVKPFLLLFLLEYLGSDAVFSIVGMEPSDQPFHSLAQLTIDLGFPRNPMINSGAIALAARLPGKTGAERCETLREWLNRLSGAQLVLDETMLASVRSLRNEANRALGNLLAHAGNLDVVETVLDTYNQICCLSGTVSDLSKLGLLLALPHEHLLPAHQRIVTALMLTCGLYEASGAFAVRIGLPIKSGVSGALLAVVPRQGAIACYGPGLDAIGNSISGLWLLEKLARALDLSIFG